MCFSLKFQGSGSYKYALFALLEGIVPAWEKAVKPKRFLIDDFFIGKPRKRGGRQVEKN